MHINRIFIVGCVILLTVAFTCRLDQLRHTSSTDFFLVWSIGKYHQINEHSKLSDIYNEASKKDISKTIKEYGIKEEDFSLLRAYQSRKDLNLCGTPVFYSLLFRFFSLDHYEKDRYVYSFSNLLLYTGSIFCLAIILNVSLIKTLLFVFFALAFYDPFYFSLNLGNVNELVLSGMVLVHLLQKYNSYRFYSHFFEGFLFSMIILFKPFFIFSLVIYLAIRLFFEPFKVSLSFLAGCLTSFAFSYLLSLKYFEIFPAWNGWFNYMKTLDLSYWADSIKWGNHSLVAGVFKTFQIDITAASYIIIILFSILFFFIVKKIMQENKTIPFQIKLTAIWSGFYFFQLATPLLWHHYLSLNIISLLILISSIEKSKRFTAKILQSTIFVIGWFCIGNRFLFASMDYQNQFYTIVSIYMALTLINIHNFMTCFLRFNSKQHFHNAFPCHIEQSREILSDNGS